MHVPFACIDSIFQSLSTSNVFPPYRVRGFIQFHYLSHNVFLILAPRMASARIIYRASVTNHKICRLCFMHSKRQLSASGRCFSQYWRKVYQERKKHITGYNKQLFTSLLLKMSGWRVAKYRAQDYLYSLSAFHSD